ncbi:MAG: DUF1499 domain-containing protein [Candidatus Binatia bacterium]
MLNLFRITVASLAIMPLFSCSGTRPVDLGIKDGRLAPCPSTPNCVSSHAADSAHAVAPLQLVIPPVEAWRALRSVLETLPRVQIITATDDYVHADCSSAFFGFVDDLELHLRAPQNIIAARSAARLGHSDFGVNRRRVEMLRGLLTQRGTIR